MSHFCSLYSTQILALQSLCLWARCSHGFIKLKLSFFLYKIWIWFLELLNTLSKRVFFTGFDSSQCHFYRIWKMILLKFKSKLVFFLRRKKKDTRNYFTKIELYSKNYWTHLSKQNFLKVSTNRKTISIRIKRKFF